MSPRIAVLSGLAVLLLFPQPSWSQGRVPGRDTTSRTLLIRGTLRNNDTSQPMENIKVDLKKLTGEVVSTAFTRTNGEFEFAGLSSGVYYLVVEEKGYEPLRESVELLGAPRWGVQLFLRRPLEFGKSAAGTTVSARELSIPRKAHEAMEKGLNRLHEKNDFKGSLPFFQRAVAELPTYYEAYYELGVAYLRLGQQAEAEQALRKSIEISENTYFPALVDLAAMLSNAQRFAEAEPVARRSLELDTNPWQGHFQLARALVGLNRVEAAEKSGLEARTRKPDFAQLHLLLANIHIRQRAYPALLEDLDSYLRLEPNGAMSAQARDMREKIRTNLAKTQNTEAAGSPKP